MTNSRNQQRRTRRYRGGNARTRAAKRAQTRAQERKQTNVPVNTPLAPATINTVNQREANLSPNIKTQMNQIKQKITNINRSLRTPQAGGRRRGCATRKA